VLIIIKELLQPIFGEKTLASALAPPPASAEASAEATSDLSIRLVRHFGNFCTSVSYCG
jgi:hypothetical protein